MYMLLTAARIACGPSAEELACGSDRWRAARRAADQWHASVGLDCFTCKGKGEVTRLFDSTGFPRRGFSSQLRQDAYWEKVEAWLRGAYGPEFEANAAYQSALAPIVTAFKADPAKAAKAPMARMVRKKGSAKKSRPRRRQPLVPGQRGYR
jgi:hypothetical protein